MSFTGDTKDQIRARLLGARNDFDEYKHDVQNTAICSNVMQVIQSLPKPDNIPDNAHGIPNIGLYWPLKGEPDLLKIAMLIENHIELPKVKGDSMVFVRYHPGDFVEKVGTHLDLYQPVSQNEMMPSVVVIPGIAFSIEGYRLGFGKGHYDRYLAQIRKIYKPVTIGVCFHETLFETLPNELHDEKLDYIVTDEVIIKT